MIDLDFIERLIRVFDASDVDSLEIERGGSRIRLAKTPPAAAMPMVVGHDAFAPRAASPSPAAVTAEAPRQTERPAASPARELLEITSPMVGTFYTAPAPDAPAYVTVGQRVSPGDTLCIIEAMKLMNELLCEVSGTVAEVCVQNAQPVEFGQVLYRVDPR
jgi:acetyl-CoA carboxylase biotin carboxyl carrier protein